MILVMGVTGSGKSYFVNKVAAGSVMEGGTLKAETEFCQVVRVGVGNHEVGIVDTPGFDDTERSDAQILDEIVHFLCTQYRLGISLKGIVYMHRITDNKMTGTARRYLEMFKRLCGKQNLKNVVLLTTMWSELTSEAKGLQRERELRKDFWMDMEKAGSTIRRYEGTRTEAEAIICRLMRLPDIVLDIQVELIDQNKRLEETNAGQWMVPNIEQNIGESGRKLQRLQLLIDEADGDDESEVVDLKKERDELLKAQQQRLNQRKKLQKRTGHEVTEHIEVEKKKDKWKGRLGLFATILGVAITATVNVILPLAGVSLGL
ncbi:P-loop containing nucleoside triphosphate hydrolase protein [Phaeosphaeriaceae sp. PMI808]|nr:P-loop containing nucleoside triphosphate hydrolase protein [Phaeosphaeriaceae sp. PMI808]